MPWELGFEPPAADAARARPRHGARAEGDVVFVCTGPVLAVAGVAASTARRLRVCCRGCATSTATGSRRWRGGRRIVVLDNHWVRGGQGDAVRDALPGVAVEIWGVDRVPACGDERRGAARARPRRGLARRAAAMTTHLFWDIDGTLLTTARAGIFALEDAALEVCDRELDLATMQTAGMTDAEIAMRDLPQLRRARPRRRLPARLRAPAARRA